MNLPFIISAEAAVRSKRVGYISIFDPRAKDIPGGLKPFYADPQLMKQATERLKADGFDVLFAGKVTITISATPRLFEQTFGVKLLATEEGITVIDSQRPDYIDTEDGSYKDILAGIAFMPKAESRAPSADPPGPDARESWQKTPSDLRSSVGYTTLFKEFANNSEGIIPPDVVILDSGFYKLKKNAYLKKYHPQRTVSVDIISYLFDNRLKEINDLLVELKEYKNDISDLLADFIIDCRNTWNSEEAMNLPLNKIPEPIQIKLREQAQVFMDISEDDSFETILEELKKGVSKCSNEIYNMVSTKKNYHGTQVAIPAFELLKDYQGRIRAVEDLSTKTATGHMEILYSLTQKKDNPFVFIVNCSFSCFGALAEESEPMGTTTYKLYKEAVKKMATTSAIVVWSAGNKYHTKPDDTPVIAERKKNMRDIEPQWPFVISAGGAYNRGFSTVYSDATHGYKSNITPKRIVPDVCGLEGPSSTPILWLPEPTTQKNDGWAPLSGTSFCAPQITAACAWIKFVWPDATTDEVRQTLIESADAVSDGRSAQEEEMKNLKHTFKRSSGNELQMIEKAPGLVNFEKAIQLASERNALQKKVLIY